MPKITIPETTLNEVKYVSMSDYIKQVDKLDNIPDKMAYTIRYLLAYGAEENRDVSLAEAIHIAKMKIADASAIMRAKSVMVPDETVDPDLTEEEDALNRKFMIEPVECLKDELIALLEKESALEQTEDRQKKVTDYQMMHVILASDELNGSISGEVSELEIEPTVHDVEIRLRSKFGGIKEFEKAYEATKPGLLSKAFGTSSKAYHNLDEAYNAFQNPDHANYGNLNALDKAAREYLQHVFPWWKPRDGMISKAAIERLSGTQKARAAFSLNILKSTAEQRKSEPVYETIVNANIQKRADMEAQAAGAEILDNAQEENAQFQQAVLEDIGGNEEVNAQEEEAYHDNFAIGPDEAENDGLEP